MSEHLKFTPTINETQRAVLINYPGIGYGVCAHQTDSSCFDAGSVCVLPLGPDLECGVKGHTPVLVEIVGEPGCNAPWGWRRADNAYGPDIAVCSYCGFTAAWGNQHNFPNHHVAG